MDDGASWSASAGVMSYQEPLQRTRHSKGGRDPFPLPEIKCSIRPRARRRLQLARSTVDEARGVARALNWLAGTRSSEERGDGAAFTDEVQTRIREAVNDRGTEPAASSRQECLADVLKGPGCYSSDQ